MKSFVKKTNVVFAAAGLAAAFALTSGSAHATLTSVVGDTKAGNTVVTTAATTAIQVGIDVQIGTSVFSALAPDQGKGTAVAAAPNGAPVGNIFNSRTLGQSAGAKPRGLGVWLQGGYTSIENDENLAQFDGNAFNVIVGIDYKPKKLKGKGVVGLAVSWEDIDIDTTFNAGTFEGSGVSVVPYVGYRFKNNIIVDASVGYSFLDYDTSRTTGGVATSSFDAQRVFGAINVGGSFKKKKFRIAPKIGVMGMWEEHDDFIDSTSAVFGKNRIHLGRLHAGGEVGYTIKAVEPFVGARVNWDFDQNSPVDLTGTGGLAQDDDIGATFSAGLNLRKKNITGQIKGETTQFKNEVTSWGVRGTIRVNF